MFNLIRKDKKRQEKTFEPCIQKKKNYLACHQYSQIMTEGNKVSKTQLHDFDSFMT
jgi:hypothetical protein